MLIFLRRLVKVGRGERYRWGGKATYFERNRLEGLSTVGQEKSFRKFASFASSLVLLFEHRPV